MIGMSVNLPLSVDKQIVWKKFVFSQNLELYPLYISTLSSWRWFHIIQSYLQFTDSFPWDNICTEKQIALLKIKRDIKEAKNKMKNKTQEA